MSIDSILIFFGIILLLAGLFGAFIPLMPGPPLSYAGFLLLHFTSAIHFSSTQLWFFGILTFLITMLDILLPIMGANKSTHGKSAMIGAGVGMVLGMFLFFPYGIIIGPIIGAWLAGKVRGQSDKEAFKAAMGSFAGVLFGIVLKFTLSMFMLYTSARALIQAFAAY